MPRMNRINRQANSNYPELRESLSPRLRALSDENIEVLFENYNLSAEDMEGFFDTLKDIGKAVVSAAPTVLPIAGAAVGTAFGVPQVGAALGNLAGNVVGQLAGPKPAPAPRPVASPQLPQAPQGASPAAGQLIQTMFRPEAMQALMQMLLGQMGGSNVKVGSTPVPVDAFTNLIRTLANQAQAEYHAANRQASDELPEYLRDYAGEAIVDPAVADQRAGALLELLQETDLDDAPVFYRRRSVVPAPADHGIRPDEDEAFYAELAAAELYDEIEE